MYFHLRYNIIQQNLYIEFVIIYMYIYMCDMIKVFSSLLIESQLFSQHMYARSHRCTEIVSKKRRKR